MRLAAIAAVLLWALPVESQGTAKRGTVQVTEVPVKTRSDSGAGAEGAVHITVENSENVTIIVEFHSDDTVDGDYSVSRDGNRDVQAPGVLGQAKGGPPPAGSVRAKQRYPRLQEASYIPCYSRTYPGGVLTVSRGRRR